MEKNEKAFEEKEFKARTLIVEREAAVADKEQVLWDPFRYSRVSSSFDADTNASLPAPEPSSKKMAFFFESLLQCARKFLLHCRVHLNQPVWCWIRWRCSTLPITIDPLQKRVAPQEKTKVDKKWMGVLKYQQPKRARANGGFYGFHMPTASAYTQPPLVFSERGAYTGVSERAYTSSGLQSSHQSYLIRIFKYYGNSISTVIEEENYRKFNTNLVHPIMGLIEWWAAVFTPINISNTNLPSTIGTLLALR
ncbi:hypothetical protein HHK36_002678 [Tetracentron sinense]|uniref:Uncharacterized protein n=1 Tax=Tetracentron sinense TaxID=13715 RepID=A0A834ZMX4_TETSI|nr:hypothetical protein HHK36_002678 [Tetracentron sinense]